MRDLCLDDSIKTKYDLSKGAFSLLENLAGKSQRWGETVASTVRKTDIATELGNDVRTVTRNINRLKKSGLIETSTKRGGNGGTVVVFNTDMLNFEVTDNPITSDSKQAEEIREIAFPKAPVKEPKRRYRTKAEIAEAKLLQGAINSKIARLNDQIEFGEITYDFFENFEDKRIYFNAYLLTRMYNAYATIVPYQRYLSYKDKDSKKAEQYHRIYLRSTCYEVLPRRFVGTPQYKKFVELAQYLADNNIHPLVYLSVQFDRADYLSSIGKARVGATPYVNTLLCDEAKEAYNNSVNFFKDLKRDYGLYECMHSEGTYYGGSYPILVALLSAYNGEPKNLSQLDSTLQELEFKKDLDKKANTLYSYYRTTLEALEESDVSEKGKATIKNFLKEQIATFSSKSGMTTTQFALAFPLQHSSARYLLEQDENFTEDDINLYLGNQSRLTNISDEDAKAFMANGKKIYMSWWGATSFQRTMFMLADFYGFKTRPSELGAYIKEFGLEKIPLDLAGMLDVSRIYAKTMTREEIYRVDANDWATQNELREFEQYN